jgi:Spy/CpxP family protein refolding chaperone
MKRTTTIALSLGAAMAFLAAALIPLTAATQETPPPAQTEKARIEPAHPLADLGLTADQKKALEEFRKARVEERAAFREKMAQLREEMRGLARDPQANQAQIDALIDRSAGLRAERLKAAFRARAERDKIFTPEQREKLKALRSRSAGRPGIDGLGLRGFGRAGFGPAGRFAGFRALRWRMARLRALRHHRLAGWRRW